ncbi:amino acid adenylation domain-containing protein [Kamptonema animale CS-326]|jgi:amino acid adenylation domain-containing protein|uniref:non-ribosomal peptide synthetase n=1 Tax=Kamptonema animale TaxID=92934 RepID=UPI0023308EFB|nr:amino acid adenylation domain-containing protein [Kamptonema animale]MDB9511762.1 amino acid adenylation domain-containing protein [Kamptonema animale CS-326]
MFPVDNSRESVSLNSVSNTIQGLIEYRVDQQPEARAINYQNHCLTYQQLNHSANQLAHYLLSLGLGAEARVCVCLQPSLEIGVALLGILKAGAVYVPLDPNYPRDRLATILQDNQPQVILTQRDVLPNLPATGPKVFCCDRDWQSIEHLSTDNPSVNIDLDQTAYIIYTSGTTGKPKGIKIGYRNLSHYILVAQERFGFDRTTIMPALARFSFSITFFELLSPLVAGGTLTILERKQILDFGQMCQILEQMTAIHASPNLLKKLLAYIEDNSIDLAKFSGLKHVSTGGDLVPANVLVAMQRVFRNAEIHVIYGCSEVSCMACSHFVSREQTITKTLVGQPFPNVAIRLYESEQKSVAIGEIGEVYISGAGVAKGYLERPELTTEKFVTIDQERWYRTGDRGRLDAQGNLEIIGRTDFQIKLNGIRIEPGEIEVVLRQIPGVRETVVVCRELNSGELGIVAYLVLHSTDPPEIDDIRRYLQSKLPEYMVPAAFIVLDALPLNLNQKVDRQALPALNFDSGNKYIAPRNELEIQLAKIWEEVLGIEPIGIKDNFFELGGHSLVAVNLLAKIENIFGKNLPLSILFQQQTIEEFAHIFSQPEWTPSWSSLVPIQTKGSQTPLFLIHAVGGNLLDYQKLIYHLGQDRPIFGLQSIGLDGKQEPLATVEAMALHYINEIKSIQPHGPYLFFGYSLGGIIAFEMAQQLCAQGEKIGWLGVCDIGVAHISNEGQNQEQNERSLAKFIKLHTTNLGKINSFKGKLEYLWDRIYCRLTLYYYKNHLVGEFSKNEISPPDFLLKLLDINMQADMNYRFKIYPGSLVLFRCKYQDVKYYFKPDLGWGDVVAGGVEIHNLRGSHFDLMKEPWVQFLAKELKASLEIGSSRT